MDILKSKGVTPTMKKAIWDLYIGIGVKEALCPLCGVHKIYSTLSNGFHAAHIVARKFFVGDMSIFYAIPSCDVCNGYCDDLCVLDYLWVRERFTSLRRIIMIIFEAFLARYAHELAEEDRMAWRVLDHLYGSARWPAGGGIVNSKGIYEVARVEQHAKMVEESARLVAQQQALSTQMRALMDSTIRPMKFI